MAIYIWKEEDLELVKELPQQVKEVINDNLIILERHYGKERTEDDLGGYVVFLDEDNIESFKDEKLKGLTAEFIDDIKGAEYILALFLLSCDFSIIVVCHKKLRHIIEV